VGFLVGVKLKLINHKCEPEENPSYGEEESLFKKRNVGLIKTKGNSHFLPVLDIP
jgi:hypothetical protein